MSTSGARNPCLRMLLVWMLRICTRPTSSGSPISTCTSSRPGRSSAWSIRSRRLVMPMMSTLLSASTPSILDSSWFTIESCTPVPSWVEPRALQMASISSKMMMCSSLASPFSACSFSASTNSSRIFSSEPPTYLSRMEGPFTILGSLALSALPSCLAMSVFPQPGGPNSSMPRTCGMPIFRTTSAGNTREAKARRKMSPNSLSRPPMPSSWKLNPRSNRRLERLPAAPLSRSGASLCFLYMMLLFLASCPNTEGCASSLASSTPSPLPAPASAARCTLNTSMTRRRNV
mmetsp:Transcript_21627/g.69636  ORF Transcript_21627/g.69636 Transcript_21627/m.69636 type:complete len:289 (-) Transcript_21627:486-1352(-)